jgi:type VI secretion system protein VasI
MLVTFALPLAVDANKVEMTYQIDLQEPVKETWDSTVDQTGAFSPKAIPTLRKMTQASKIAFQVNYQDRANVIKTSFDLDGLTEALKPINAACNWK